jgi:hypothetical protein
MAAAGVLVAKQAGTPTPACIVSGAVRLSDYRHRRHGRHGRHGRQHRQGRHEQCQVDWRSPVFRQPPENCLDCDPARCQSHVCRRLRRHLLLPDLPRYHQTPGCCLEVHDGPWLRSQERLCPQVGPLPVSWKPKESARRSPQVLRFFSYSSPFPEGSALMDKPHARITEHCTRFSACGPLCPMSTGPTVCTNRLLRKPPTGARSFERLALLAPRGMRLFNALPHRRGGPWFVCSASCLDEARRAVSKGRSLIFSAPC